MNVLSRMLLQTKGGYGFGILGLYKKSKLAMPLRHYSALHPIGLVHTTSSKLRRACATNHERPLQLACRHFGLNNTWNKVPLFLWNHPTPSPTALLFLKTYFPGSSLRTNGGYWYHGSIKTLRGLRTGTEIHTRRSFPEFWFSIDCFFSSLVSASFFYNSHEYD